ncbi:simple sugar transport system substrate-binding protein [Rhodobium orientis]|uniref:LacI family transcriptional regulator n=1 Tax=Rhodobium orientis TaxID=34017 RepID=A0A327JP79_9HYPH|nr:substrate-binding domain-containing protein [Rhodobium orientis]MBB4304565.1 simple sugar transport system substrate-binding protein [Rhodobium orientis]MBK5951400.1 LacI family transcriptional regulator [Rhodobium orientis]RAI27525.1 LacI family transcriptional regulator [Rhodobium orientis]
MISRKMLVGTIAAAVMTAGMASGAMAETTIGVVAKIGGIPWFNAMEAGIEQEGKARGVDAFMVGPTSADPALQVRAIEDLIARKVDVIGVVPNDAKVLEPVLQKARDAGIIVLTHESTASVNKNYDFELVSAKDLGEAHAKLLAKTTECKGGYAVYVGGLTVPAHNAWADAAVAWLDENCPDMKQVADRFGVAESVDDSRNTTLDLIRAHDDLTGILAFGSQGPVGAARAVEERGLIGKVAVVGLFSAGQGRKLVHSGAITGGYVWSPLEAGRVFVALGKMLAEGGTVSDGDELPLLGKIRLEGSNIFANMPLALSKDTVDGLAEMGL